MNIKDLDKIVGTTHKNLIDIESSVPTSNDNGKTEEQQQQEQKILDIGRLTEIYESNLNMLTNYLPNVPDKDLTRYPKHYSDLKERIQREISEYENMTAIAIENAAKAGVSKQEMAEFAQDCKKVYLEECRKKQELLSKIMTVIHSDGTMTSTNTETGETARFDNAGNPLD